MVRTRGVSRCTAIATRVSCARRERQHGSGAGAERIATLEAELTRLTRENAVLRQQLDALCQKLFGKKSERVSADQLRLAFAQLAEELKSRDEPTEMDTGERPGPQHRRLARPTGRRALPPQLPRERVEIDVPEAEKRCACGAMKARIGEAVSEKLDYV